MTDTLRAGKKSLTRTVHLLSGIAVITALVTGCSLGDSPDETPPPEPIDVSSVENAVPEALPLSKYGNPTSYVVAGKRYYTMPTNKGYSETGIASWYGTEFQGKRTSSGETYENYGMTAAHRTLPLPTFVKVTNKQNGRSVIVKVNDRGPFHNNRLIDLSYVAAVKLGIVGYGTGLVEVSALDPEEYNRESGQQLRQASKELYLQAGAFNVRKNAERLRANLETQGLGQARIVEPSAENTAYLVQLGPFRDAFEAEPVADALKPMGIDAITRYEVVTADAVETETVAMETVTADSVTEVVTMETVTADSTTEVVAMETVTADSATEVIAMETVTAGAETEVMTEETITAEAQPETGKSRWKFWQKSEEPAASAPEAVATVADESISEAGDDTLAVVASEAAASASRAAAASASSVAATSASSAAQTAAVAAATATPAADAEPMEIAAAEPDAEVVAMTGTQEAQPDTGKGWWKFWESKEPETATTEAVAMTAETTVPEVDTEAVAMTAETTVPEADTEAMAMTAETTAPEADTEAVAMTAETTAPEADTGAMEVATSEPEATVMGADETAPEPDTETMEVAAMETDAGEAQPDTGKGWWKFWESKEPETATTEAVTMTAETTVPETDTEAMAMTAETTVPETDTEAMAMTAETTVPETDTEAMAMTAETTVPETDTEAMAMTTETTVPEAATEAVAMTAETTAPEADTGTMEVATSEPEATVMGADETAAEPDTETMEVAAMETDEAQPDTGKGWWKFWESREPEAGTPAVATGAAVVEVAASTPEPTMGADESFQEAGTGIMDAAAAETPAASKAETMVALETATPEPAPAQPVQQDTPSVYMQTGAFRLRENAERLRPYVEAVAPGAFKVIETSGPRRLYKIQIGPLADAGEAMVVKRELKAVGINPVITGSDMAQSGSRSMKAPTKTYYRAQPVQRIEKPAMTTRKTATSIPAPRMKAAEMHADVHVSPEPEPKMAEMHADVHVSPEPEPKMAEMHADVYVSPEPEPKMAEMHADVYVSPEPEPVQPRRGGDKTLYQQAGAFARPNNATRLRTRIVDETLEPTEIVQQPNWLAKTGDRVTLHKVQVGPLEDKTKAMEVKGQLIPMGVTDSFPVYREQ